jgi:hypothetical protein
MECGEVALAERMSEDEGSIGKIFTRERDAESGKGVEELVFHV